MCANWGNEEEKFVDFHEIGEVGKEEMEIKKSTKFK